MHWSGAAALAVITYHSGEDRLVKLAFREWASALRLPAAPAGLYLPRSAAGPARAAQADHAVGATRSPPTRGRGAPSCGSSESSMRLKGRHWLMLWLLVFLGVLLAIATRQTRRLPHRSPAARPARGARRPWRHAGPSWSDGSGWRRSRQVLVPLARARAGPPRAGRLRVHPACRSRRCPRASR